MVCFDTLQGYCYYGDVLLGEREECGASIKVLQESEKCKLGKETDKQAIHSSDLSVHHMYITIYITDCTWLDKLVPRKSPGNAVARLGIQLLCSMTYSVYF